MFLPIYEMNWVRDECRYAGLSPASFELEAERHAHLNIAALTLTLEFVDDSSARTAEDRVACALDDHVLDFGGRGTTTSRGGGGFLSSSIALVSMGARTASTTFFARPLTSAQTMKAWNRITNAMPTRCRLGSACRSEKLMVWGLQSSKCAAEV